MGTDAGVSTGFFAGGSSEESAFLRAIRETPDDDAPLWIYADWLEERGDLDRAELIRVQVEQSRLPIGHVCLDRTIQEQSLLNRCQDQWKQSLPTWPGLNWGHFERGLIRSVQITKLDPAIAADPQGALFAHAPIQQIEYRGQPPKLHEIQAIQEWTQFAPGLVLRFGFDQRYENYDLIWSFINQGVFQGFSGLALDHWSLPASALATLTASANERLVYLNLSGNEFQDEEALILAESPRLKGLRELDLTYNEVGLEGAVALLNSPWLAGLRRLGLRDNEVLANPTRVNPWSVSAKETRSLESLDLRRNTLGRPSVLNFGDAAWLTNLAELNLADNEFRACSLEPLVHNSCLQNLRYFNLNYQFEIGSTGATLLAQAPWLQGLTTLRLKGCGIGDQGMDALLNSAYLGDLQWFDLSGNNLREPILRQLLDHPRMQQLQVLQITGNLLDASSTSRLKQRYGSKIFAEGPPSWDGATQTMRH